MVNQIFGLEFVSGGLSEEGPSTLPITRVQSEVHVRQATAPVIRGLRITGYGSRTVGC